MVLEQNSVLDVIGFIPLSQLMGLPIISRHVLIPIGTASEAHLLTLFVQTNLTVSAKNPSVAFVRVVNKVKKASHGTEKKDQKISDHLSVATRKIPSVTYFCHFL